MILEAHVTKAVVDGQYGEVSVTFVSDAALENVQITASTKPLDPNAPATPALGFVPDNEGYVVATVAKGATVTRTFAIKPVAAAAGKTYVGQVQVAWKGSGAPVATTFQIPVEARPEVYAALGAVEHLRRTFLGAYESLKQVGKTVHQDTQLPDSGGEPVEQALRPETFQWALSMVEMGTQLFRQNVPTGTSGGTSGTGTPKANG